MPTVQVPAQLIVEHLMAAVKQLSPSEWREFQHQLSAWQAQAEEARAQREARLDYAETQLRRLCAERGQDWDAMSAEEREAFIDDLVHEDRSCAG